MRRLSMSRVFALLEVLLAVVLATGAGLCAGTASVVLGVGVGLVVAALCGFALVYLAQVET